MEIRTHQTIDHGLCGKPLELREGFCRIEMKTTGHMAVDAAGLIHGGFVFGLADHAAMIAVNHPNVVLGSAEVRFLHPLKAGDSVVAEAAVETVSGKKHTVGVTVTKDDAVVFTGTFFCFVLKKHVLD